jgi:DNA mismatch repair protein MutS
MGYPATKQNLPPMMVRYLEYKERYPDALLFFQVGDFYELFYDDAVTVAKSLNLTLTSRDKNSPEPVPMCGVPISVLDSYVDRLLPLGYSVAVVSQVGSGQGVDRSLERFVTPGMRLFTSVSSDATESLIAAVAIDPQTRLAALAFTDPQTGVVKVKDGIELSALQRELAALMVREVVIPRSALGERIDRRTSWVRSIEGAITPQALRFRADPTAQSEGEASLAPAARADFLGFSPTAKRAVRLLLSYIDEISLGNAIPISEVSVFKATGIVTIDAATRRNLELVQNFKDGSTNGTLFGFLNSTETPGGARMLKGWIVAPLASLKEITERQGAVKELLGVHQVVASGLSGLNDLERLSARLQLKVASPKDLAGIRDTLERLPTLQDNLAHCSSRPLREIVDLLAPPFELRSLLKSALVDSPPHVTNDGGIFKSGYDPELDEINTLKISSDEWRAKFEGEERARTGIASLKVRSNNVIGFFLEVPTAQGARVPEHYQRRQSTANAERFVTPELKRFEDQVITAVDRQIRREQMLFNDLRDECLKYIDMLRAIAHALSELDALTSLARTASRYNWVCPTLLEGDTSLVIEQGRHPIIEARLGGAFIPNSVTFECMGTRCFVITGPNMGGKSTFLRQIAIITILAQIGSFVPASAARIGLVDRIFARLGAADDLHEGESTFMVEMREAAQILAHATESSLVLIDELGRGTATTDGQSLAQAVLERLALGLRCRTLFATHYHEITALEGALAGIKNLSVGSIEEGDRVVFTHAIQPGPAPRSYGIEVAKLSGLPMEVINRAVEILTQPSDGVYKATFAKPIQPMLFYTPEPRVEPIDPKAQALTDAVSKVDPNSLAPKDALLLIYQLKELLG